MPLLHRVSPILDGAAVQIGDGTPRLRSLLVPAAEYPLPAWVKPDNDAARAVRLDELPARFVATAGSLSVVSSDPGTTPVSASQAPSIESKRSIEASRGVPIEVRTTAGGSDYPNEPVGFTRIAEHELTVIPSGSNGLAGDWTNDGDPDLTTVTDATAPQSPDGCVRMKFPNGMGDGIEPARFDGWGPSIDFGGSNDYDEIYVSVHMKIEGPDFESQTQVNKILYVAYASTTRQNHSFLGFNGPGADQGVFSEMRVDMFISEMDANGDDPGGGAVRHNPNQNTLDFTCGDWHQLELWMKINDIGSSNGEVKWWLDGTFLGHHTGFKYRSSQNPLGFYHLQFTPVWGGDDGDVRTRDDWWRMDHMYISRLNEI